MSQAAGERHGTRVHNARNLQASQHMKPNACGTDRDEQGKQHKTVDPVEDRA